MALDSLSDFFMPEERKSGEDLFDKDVVSIASATDTHATAYIKDSGSPRVTFTAENIENPVFQAACTCTRGKKGRLCKHLWATLLKIDADGYDFLACRREIEMAPAKPESAASLAAKQRQKDRQDEYKQKMKELNKERNKKLKEERAAKDQAWKKKFKKDSTQKSKGWQSRNQQAKQQETQHSNPFNDGPAPVFLPKNVEAARNYFLDNGFELSLPLQMKNLDEARRVLARVFHPDKGGTHEEILTLNENHDIIATFIKS